MSKDFTKLESESSIARTVNDSLENQVKVLERKSCWSNAQYSRREMMEYQLEYRYVKYRQVRKKFIQKTRC